jgi:hypothetical protein
LKQPQPLCPCTLPNLLEESVVEASLDAEPMVTELALSVPEGLSVAALLDAEPTVTKQALQVPKEVSVAALLDADTTLLKLARQVSLKNLGSLPNRSYIWESVTALSEQNYSRHWP